MRIYLNEQSMERFLESLLCLKSRESWTYKTMNDSLSIVFKGNILNVRKELFSWLKAHGEDEFNKALLG